MLGEITIDVTNIVERVVTVAIVAMFATAVSVYVTRARIRMLADALSRLSDSLAAMSNAVTEQEKEIAELRNQRTQCELRAARNFATHREVAQVISDNTTMMVGLRDQMGDLHEKINPIAEQLAHIQGTVDARLNAR